MDKKSGISDQEVTWTCRLQRDPRHPVGIRVFLRQVKDSQVQPKVVMTNKDNEEKQYTWPPVSMKDPKNPASTRMVMTRVRVPKRLALVREAILIPGPVVSGPVPKWQQRVQAVLHRAKQQEVKLPFEATGRTPANRGTKRPAGPAGGTLQPAAKRFCL